MDFPPSIPINYAKMRKRRQHAIRCQTYYHKHIDKMREQKNLYYHNNKEKILLRKKAYYENNREKILEYKRNLYLKKKEANLTQINDQNTVIVATLDVS